jgi:hypothetical protein
MKLFAYWGLAVRPQSRRALLISYGLGNTGEALARADGLERIDVVDISPTILALGSSIERPHARDPLEDPRVHVHVEDGRFFLLAGTEPYDLITAEPPPPRGAGIVNLYSREYFQLVRRRLAPGGVTTHWLPVNQLSVRDTKGIAAAFCQVFADCTLWTGAGLDWMLAGTNGMATPPAEDAFARLWTRPGSARDLADLGIERPEQLGALFLADAEALARWVGDTPPLVDDRPGRLSQSAPPRSHRRVYHELMDARLNAEAFSSSASIRRLWPRALAERTTPWFRWQRTFDEDFRDGRRLGAMLDLWDVLEETPLEVLPLLLLDSEPRIRDIALAREAAGDRHPALSHHLGAAALAERDYETAARHFALASSRTHPPALLRALAVGLAGRPSEALETLQGVDERELPDHARAWLSDLVIRLAIARKYEAPDPNWRGPDPSAHAGPGPP